MILELSLILLGCSYFENSWATGASAASAFGGVNVFIRNYDLCRMNVIEKLLDLRGMFFVFTTYQNLSSLATQRSGRTQLKARCK